jgi:hypothetical protein
MFYDSFCEVVFWSLRLMMNMIIRWQDITIANYDIDNYRFTDDIQLLTSEV